MKCKSELLNKSHDEVHNDMPRRCEPGNIAFLKASEAGTANEPEPEEVDIQCWNCREGRKGRVSASRGIYCSACGAKQCYVGR